MPEIRITKNQLELIYNSKDRFIKTDKFSLVKPDESKHEWLIMGKKIGQGQYGHVYQANHKMVFNNIKNFSLEPAHHVIKIELINDTIDSVNKRMQAGSEECIYLRRHGISAELPLLVNNMIFTVMENCGESLTNFLNGNDANLEQRLEYALSITNELFILQKKGTIHCDIKPDNICVKRLKFKKQSTNDSFLQFLLIDFGLAYSEHDQRCVDAGTSLYLPPEVAKGIRTVASDLYALAAVLAQIFGCDQQLLFSEKRKAYSKDHFSIFNVPYVFKKLFSGFYNCGFDKGFKDDLKSLLKELSDPNPDNRPSVEVLMKFFIHSRWHRKRYQEQSEVQLKLSQAKDQAQALNQSIDELNNHINILIKKLKDQGISPLQIDMEKPVPVPFPSYYCAIKESIKDTSKIEQLIADIEPRIPDFNKEQQRIQNKQNKLLAFEKLLDTLHTLLKKPRCKNSSGLKEIQAILSKENRILAEKQLLVQKVALQKSQGLNAWYSRSSLFGRGRNPQVDTFYRETAGLAPSKNAIV